MDRWPREQIRTGERITVVESELGNILLLICLDLFHVPSAPAIRASHANLFLVPSLSPTTSAHQTEAAAFSACQLASTFVCNRCAFDPQPNPKNPDGTSFYRLPVRESALVRQFTQPADTLSKYLIFRMNP